MFLFGITVKLLKIRFKSFSVQLRLESLAVTVMVQRRTKIHKTSANIKVNGLLEFLRVVNRRKEKNKGCVASQEEGGEGDNGGCGKIEKRSA